MDIKLTQENSVLKTAGTFCKEDINIDASALASGGGGVNFNLRVTGSAFDYADDVKVEYSLDGADFVEFNGGQYNTTINLTGSCIILKIQRSDSASNTYTGTNLLFGASDNQFHYRAYRPESNETIGLNRMLD